MTITEPDGATPLDPDERQGLKFPHITTRGELDELEQANIEQGLVWVSRRRRVDIFDDAFNRLLHRQLFGEVWRWAGEYRRAATEMLDSKWARQVGNRALELAEMMRTGVYGDT